MSAGLRLGEYELLSPIAKGGQGVVWDAVHLVVGASVAIKVLATDRGNPAARRMFASEVRSLARLDHPAVVRIFDHGVVPADLAARSDGQLRRGAPWLAMERVSGGTLAQAQHRPQSEAQLLRLLRSLARGLAHAHARGVLHLDLKPANVLVAEHHDDRPGLRITDFGISRLAGQVPVVAGTRSWAAPEQLAGQLDRYGPWTDLFALGRMAERLAPAERSPELVAWIARATSPEPADRFRSAAEARRALPPGDEPPPEGRGVLPAMGLSLFALRRPPLVGRHADLTRLCHFSDVVRSEGLPSLVQLRGQSGCGRTALADAFVESLVEDGVDPSHVRVWHDLHPDAAPPPELWAPGPGLDVAILDGPLPVRWPAARWTLTLRPLGPRQMLHALHGWLPIEPGTATTAASLADGRPARARAVVERWIEAGQLEFSATGWRLRSRAWEVGAAPEVEGLGARVLDLLAVFGPLLPDERLRRALADHPEPDLDAALSALQDRALVLQRGDAWMFARAGLQEEWAAAMSPARWQGVAAVAEAATDDPVRRARALGGGDLERTVTALLAAAGPARSATRAQLLADAVRCLDQLGEQGPRRIEAEVSMHDAARLHGLQEEPGQLALAERALRIGAPELAARALAQAAFVCVDHDAARAEAHALRAVALGGHHVTVFTALTTARANLDRPDGDRELRAWVEAHGDQPYALQTLGYYAEVRGDDDEAERWYLRALRADPAPMPVGLSGLAELLKRRGDHDAAEKILHEQLLTLRSGAAVMPQPLAAVIQLNRADIALRRGDHARCRAIFAELAREEGALPLPISLIHDLLVAECAAHDAELVEFDVRFGRFRVGWSRFPTLAQRDTDDSLLRIAGALMHRDRERMREVLAVRAQVQRRLPPDLRARRGSRSSSEPPSS